VLKVCTTNLKIRAIHVQAVSWRCPDLLPFNQRVDGSNPSGLTNVFNKLDVFLVSAYLHWQQTF